MGDFLLERKETRRKKAVVGRRLQLNRSAVAAARLVFFSSSSGDVEIALSLSLPLSLSPPSTHTLTSFIPAASSESLMFCACAGACEPQPMTPTFLIPSQASGSLES